MRGGFSPRKQPTFHYATTGFPAKWRLRNEGKNSLRMKCHHPDLDSASDWLKQISRAARSIKSTTQIFVVTRRQYGIFARVSQTSFRGKTSGGLGRVCTTEMYRSIGHVEFPKSQTGIFVEWKATLVSETFPSELSFLFNGLKSANAVWKQLVGRFYDFAGWLALQQQQLNFMQVF